MVAPASALRQMASAAGTPRRVAKGPSLRRDTSDDFARPDTEVDPDGFPRPRGLHFSGLRFRLKGNVPRSLVGRVAAGAVVLGGLAGFTAVLWQAHAMLLASPELTIRSSSSIQITGNQHLTRPQLLSVFGDDVDRNLLTVSLEDRRKELEQLPWVEHATVMRLLPNKLRVAIVERTPVAFVRQGSRISLVDKSGVLLDISPDAPAANHYSFPVVTGINQDDPLSTRAARMDLFERFLTELDSGTEKVSQTISEVDLSSPEDVKALLATGSGPQASDILVHFGSEDFLPRYQKFQQRLPEWKAQYPKLASVDMRYDRQVVLEMAPGSAAPGEAKPSAAPSKSAPSAKPIAKPAAKGAKLPAKAPAHAALKPAHPVKPTPAASRPAAKPTPTQASPQ
jgi:cell division protein FtsQ